MDEVIEKIVAMAEEAAAGFGHCDRSFIYGEVAERLTDLQHDELCLEYLGKPDGEDGL